MLEPVPCPPAPLVRLEAPPLADDLPTWDGTPFDLAYSVEMLYSPPDRAPENDLAPFFT